MGAGAGAFTTGASSDDDERAAGAPGGLAALRLVGAGAVNELRRWVRVLVEAPLLRPGLDLGAALRAATSSAFASLVALGTPFSAAIRRNSFTVKASSSSRFIGIPHR